MFSTSRKLTERQTQVLVFIRDFKNQEGVAPTYREIAHHFGFKSTKAAVDHVRALKSKGYVTLAGRRSRSIMVGPSDADLSDRVVSIPLLGEIPAGQPESKEENTLGRIAVDGTMLDLCKGHRLFALMVSGESMIGRNIRDGDWAIVDADASAKEGEVVVALIDGGNTLKTLAKKKDSFYLKSENPDHPNWIPLTEMIVQGVVKAVIRRV